MGQERNIIRLYSPQAEAVWKAVMEDGIAFSRREYVIKKYEESAKIFLTAYDAYIREAEKIVPRPDDKAYPYWAFASKELLDATAGGKVMTLTVPVDEAVFFDQYEWYKVLRLSYIGENSADEEAFAQELAKRGIRDSSEVMLKPFYPDMKKRILDSWKRLFRFDEAIRNGEETEARAVQAGLWYIKKEWLSE